MAKPIDSKERQRIIDLLHEHGGNRNKVARMVKRSPSTIQRIAEAAGIESNIPAPKNASRWRSAFAAEDRIQLIGYALDRGGELLDLALTPQQYQQVMTGIAIGIDKHRLETGEATSRTDTAKEHHERETRFDRLYSELERASASRAEEDADSSGGNRGEPVDTNGSAD